VPKTYQPPNINRTFSNQASYQTSNINVAKTGKMNLLQQGQQQQMLVSSPRLYFLCICFLIAIVTTQSFAIVPSPHSTSMSTSVFSQYVQQKEQRQLNKRIHRSPPPQNNVHKLYSLPSSAADDAINDQVAKARKLLEEAKAKVAAAQADAEASQSEQGIATEAVTTNDSANITEEESQKRKESVIKTQNDETGLITTDGELMAALSEMEDWEIRSLEAVFVDENKKRND